MTSTELSQKIDRILCGLEQNGLSSNHNDFCHKYLSLLMREVSEDTALWPHLEELRKRYPAVWTHSVTVAALSGILAQSLGYTGRRATDLFGLGGLLHDLGFVSLHESLVHKEEDLSLLEWTKLKEHPWLALNLIQGSNRITDEIKKVVYQHHEEIGGGGYPLELSSDQIFYPAKVISAVDSFEALINDRSYRPAYSVEQALQIMHAQTGKYDREVLRAISKIFAPQVFRIQVS